MTCCPNILKIIDPESNRTIMLELNEHEYQRATTDIAYAQELLSNFYAEENLTDRDGNSRVVNFCISEDALPNENETSNLVEDSTWSEAETLLLISLYEDHKEDFSHAKRKKFVWDIICEKMAAEGFNKSAQKIERKWINLLRTYRAIKDNKGPKKTGRGAQSYKFYEKLDDILGVKPSNKSGVAIEVGVADLIESKIKENNVNVSTSTTENAVTSDIDKNVAHQEITSPTPSVGNSSSTDLNSHSTPEIESKKNRKQKSKRLLKDENYQQLKQKRHEERMQLEKEKLEVEKKRVKLLDMFLQHNIQMNKEVEKENISENN